MKNKISYEIVKSSASPLPEEFWTQLPELFAHEGETIYKGRNEIKNFIVDNHTVCVKKYSVPPLLNRLLYSWGWRTPKAKHTYENAREILARGFDSPVQYGYVIVRQNGLIRESYSAGAFVANSRTVGQDKQDADLIRALARYTAALHAKGLMHRDYILNNVLYTHDENGYHFTLIDVNRFVFRDKPIRGFLQRMNLMQPFSDQGELRKFVQAYEEVVCTPGQLTARVARFRRWRSRYSRLKRVLKKIPGARRLSKHG